MKRSRISSTIAVVAAALAIGAGIAAPTLSAFGHGGSRIYTVNTHQAVGSMGRIMVK